MAYGAIMGQTPDLSKYLKNDGTGSMTGNLNMNNNKITNVTNGSNSKDAVNYSQLQTKLSTSGGTMTGPINMGNNKITNIANGTANTDVANVGQMNTAISNLSSNVSNLFAQEYGRFDLGFVIKKFVRSGADLPILSASNGSNIVITGYSPNTASYYSTDNGTTWKPTNQVLGDILYYKNYFYASYVSSNSLYRRIYRSSTGSSWSQVYNSNISLPQPNGPILGCTSSYIIAIDTDTVIGSPSYSQSSNNVFSSSTGNSSSWNSSNSIILGSRQGLSINDCSKSTQTNGIIVATDKGLYYQNSYSPSNNWSNISSLGSGEFSSATYWNGNFYALDNTGQLFKSGSSTITSSDWSLVATFQGASSIIGNGFGRAKIIPSGDYLLVISPTSKKLQVSSDGNTWGPTNISFTGYSTTNMSCCYNNNNNTISFFKDFGNSNKIYIAQAQTDACLLEKVALATANLE